ncbi:MAG: hypothetical protein MK214_20235 [Thalassotalea sp.]|nr:hypothetical protein [Thalassotalea sp.]
MQVIHHLPELEELAMPTNTAIKLLELLIEPFGTFDKANAFWQTYPCVIIYSSSQDNLSTTLASLSDELLHLVELAETSPEFVEPLPKGYQVSLTIINDEGNGLYLTRATDKPFSVCLGEVISHE